MCRCKTEGGRRCPTNHAAHNTRRRRNRARDKTIRKLATRGVTATPGSVMPAEYFVGRGKLDPTQVEPAHDHPDSPWNKPQGGLWTSPAINTDQSNQPEMVTTAWSSWMDREGQLGPDHAITRVSAAHDAVIVTIRDQADVNALATAFPPTTHRASGEPHAPFSYTAAREAGIDAIHADQAVTGFNKPLEGWDIESTVWLNPGKVRLPDQDTFTPGRETSTNPHEEEPAPAVMSWDQVKERFPVYSEWGTDHAVNELAHVPDGEMVTPDLTYTEEKVDLRRIRFQRYPEDDRYPTDNQRVSAAREGYKAGEPVPPVLLVSRAGELHTVDGHHRLTAQESLGMHTVVAIVAYSQRLDRYDGKVSLGYTLTDQPD